MASVRKRSKTAHSSRGRISGFHPEDRGSIPLWATTVSDRMLGVAPACS